MKHITLQIEAIADVVVRYPDEDLLTVIRAFAAAENKLANELKIRASAEAQARAKKQLRRLSDE